MYYIVSVAVGVGVGVGVSITWVSVGVGVGVIKVCVAVVVGVGVRGMVGVGVLVTTGLLSEERPLKTTIPPSKFKLSNFNGPTILVPVEDISNRFP